MILVTEVKMASNKKSYEALEKELTAAKEQIFANEYALMQHRLASVAMNIGLWDMDVAGNDLTDPDNVFTWSQEFRNMLGFSDENDFPNVLDSWSSRLHPEDHDAAVAAFAAHMHDRTGKTPYDIEYRLRLKNGEYRHFQALGTTLRDRDGNPLRAAGAIKDITESRFLAESVQNTLVESARTIDSITTILNQSGAMIYVADPDTDEVLFMTDSMKAHFGIIGDISGRTCFEMLMPGQTRRCDFCRYHNLEKKSGMTLVTEEHSRATNGYYRKVDRIVDWPGGTTVRIQYLTDLTSMKQAQDMIEQREKLLAAFNQMKATLLSQKNKTLETILGESLQPIAEAASLDRIDIHLFEDFSEQARSGHVFRWDRVRSSLTDPDDPQPMAAELPFPDSWNEQLRQGTRIHIRADLVTQEEDAFLNAWNIRSMLLVPVFINDDLWGAVAFQDLFSTRFFDKDSERFLDSAANLCADAFIRNQIKSELASAEERVKLMMDASPLSCKLWNSSFEVIDCNIETIRLFGFHDKPDFMERRPEIFPLYQPCGQNSQEKLLQYLKKAAEEGSSSLGLICQTLDGTPVPLEVILVKVAHGQDFAIAGYARDLREHNRMMSKLQQQKEELELQSTTLQTIIDSIPDLIFCKDLNSRYTLLNNASLRFFNTDLSLIGKGPLELDFPDELRHAMISTDKGIIRSGRLSVTEEWLTPFNGAQRYFTTTKAPIKRDGEVVGIVGVSRDITENHARALEIRAAHEMNEIQLAKLNLVLKGAKIGLWDADYVEGDFTHPSNTFNWSDDFRRMLELTDDDAFENVYASQDERIHPEDRDRAVEAFRKHLADTSGQTEYDVELRIMRKSGEYGYFRETCETMRDESGNPVRSAGALLDITESRKLTDALNAAVLESGKTIDIMSTILNSTDAMIYVTDTETQELLFINEYMKAHFGIAGDVEGQPCYSVLNHGAEKQCAWCPRHRLDLNPDQAITWEMHNPRTNRFYRSTDRYIDWPGGKKAHVQHCVDLTDIRQMQDEMNDAQRKLHTINSVAFQLLNSEIDTFEDILHQSMLSLAEIMEIDRISIFKNHLSEGELYTSRVFDWPENTPSALEEQFTINVSYTKGLPAFLETLSGGNVINSLVRDLPPKEQSWLKRMGVQSVLVLPIFVEDQFWGFVGFDNCHRDRLFTKRDESILWSAGVLFVHAWMRNETLASLRETSSQLKLALADAQFANKSKDDFLRTVSHEIRTPMNVILGLTEIQLQAEESDDEGRLAFRRIHAAGDVLLGIINDILDMSKIEEGKLTVVPETYEVTSLISDTLQTNLVRMGSNPIEFRLHIDENIPALLHGDALRIKQILNNLLSNAFKYTDEGHVSLSFYSEPGADEESVLLVFEVSDTGQGMTEDELSRIFDMYTRFNLEVNQSVAGTGLGMSILKNLLDLMGGEIVMESEPGKGSRFTVKLPQGRLDSAILGADLVQSLYQFELYGDRLLRRVLITRESMPYGSVLIVDDVESNIVVARGLMLPYELQIDTAQSGFEAIEKIESGHVYDLILMDHMMPRMDGMEAMKIMKAMGYNHPIVALTANAVIGQAEIFIQNGFDDFLSKPIDIRQLNNLLNRYIRDKFLDQAPDVVAEARQQASAARERGPELKIPEPDATLTMQAYKAFIRDATSSISVLDAIRNKHAPWSDDDKKMFEVHAHGMKSALAIIGLSELSGVARKLETADYDADAEALRASTAGFIESLRTVITDLTRKVKKHRSDAESENRLFLHETLLAIRKACDNYDIQILSKSIRQLRKNPGSVQMQALVAEMTVHLLQSDFNAIATLVDEYLESETDFRNQAKPESGAGAD